MRLGYPTNTRARSAIGRDALALESAGRRASSAFENDFSTGSAPTGLSDKEITAYHRADKQNDLSFLS